MTKPFTYLDVERLNKQRHESATTSANVGVYEVPLGAPRPAGHSPKPFVAPNTEGFSDVAEYLRGNKRTTRG
jgi:hypothetical protein